jgi:hypothetical protein
MVAGAPCDGAPGKILCSGYLRAVTPARRKTPRPRTPAEDEFAEVAATAARATFAVFHDDPTSALYCAAGMTPEETWRAVTEQVAVIAADAAVEAIRGYNAAPQDVSRWHRLIFETWFPEQAGRVRRGDEQGQYGVLKVCAPEADITATTLLRNSSSEPSEHPHEQVAELGLQPDRGSCGVCTTPWPDCVDDP